jgi:RNA polymerase sigma-70 factor (ECF subfamily)
MRRSAGPVSIVASATLAALLAGCGHSGPTAAPPTSTGGLDLTRETTHFLIRYGSSDASCIDAVATHLEANQQRICSDLSYTLDFKVVLEIYPDLTSLHRAMGAPSAPDWVLGLTNLSGEIKIISPLNPGPNHTFHSILLCMDHEFTHAAVLRGLGATGLPTWLSEGTAGYEARFFDSSSWTAFEPYVRAGRIPTFSALEDGSSYGDNGGYFWSYTIVDFAMAAYGRDTLRPWLDNLGSFGATFGVGEDAFRARWVEYLKAHYPAAGDASRPQRAQRPVGSG